MEMPGIFLLIFIVYFSKLIIDYFVTFDKGEGSVTMDKQQLEQEFISLVGEVMPELTDVDLKADFVSEYGVNSISIIRLIVAVEEKFEVSFTDYELALEGYKCFGDVVALVEKKLDDKE